MTISYVQASNPFWYFTDLTGLPAGAGSLESSSSLNPTVDKPIYQDPAGLLPYSNPILISLNGTIPTMYFAVNSADPQDNYNINVFDSQGNLIEQLLNFTPPSGSGGGGSTNVFGLENLVVNNVFYRNVTDANAPLPMVLTIAPGVHQGLAATTINPNFGPDINFIKNNTNAVDAIHFIPFNLGDDVLSPDNTPYEYLEYSCTNTPTGEIQKCIQIPITSKVQNLNNQTVTVSIWARANSGPGNTITMGFAQFFGDGNGTTDPIVSPAILSASLTDEWALYTATGNIPSTASFNTNGCGNDGLFLQINLPLNAACNIDLTKPSAYLGAFTPTINFSNNDEISSIVDSPRTGDIRIALNSFSPYGWVPMTDGVIGNTGSSVMSPLLTARANNDTFPLFNLIWNTFFSNQTVAPMYSPTSITPVAYGSSAAADFIALNSISLTKQAGRLIASVGTPSSGNNTGTDWPVGGFTGNELNNEIVNHVHLLSPTASAQLGSLTGTTSTIVATSGVGTAVTTQNPTGGVGEVNIQNPVAYQNFYMKL